MRVVRLFVRVLVDLWRPIKVCRCAKCEARRIELATELVRIATH